MKVLKAAPAAYPYRSAKEAWLAAQAKCILRFFFEWGGGCLWPGNDAAYLDLGPYDSVSLLDLGGSFDMIRNARLPWVALVGISLLPAAASVDPAPGAEQPAEPKVVSINPAELAAIKAKLAADPKFLRPARDSLIEGADKALNQRPLSVLDKKKSVTGADSHDYVSYAPYFWPVLSGKIASARSPI